MKVNSDVRNNKDTFTPGQQSERSCIRAGTSEGVAMYNRQVKRVSGHV